jgi:cell wall-associated NlpC family hydrolase
VAFLPARRYALISVAITASLLAPAAVALATPPGADPAPVRSLSVPDIQRELSRLALQNDQLVEQYDHAQVEVGKARTAAKQAQRVADKAQARYDQARALLISSITNEYENGGMGATSSMLLGSSGDGSSYLDQLSTYQVVNNHDAGLAAAADQAEQDAQAAVASAQHTLRAAAARRSAVVAKQQAVKAELAHYTALINSLDAAQKAQFVQSINPALPPSVFSGLTFLGSKQARQAVKFALQQVGKPYVWGAAGPDAFDCSGLTMAAWATAGVALPHSAADQYNYGTHVALSQLKPGDLIFMYQPIGHVTIYIGSGLMVSAPTEGEPVSVVRLSQFIGDVVGATHLG